VGAPRGDEPQGAAFERRCGCGFILEIRVIRVIRGQNMLAFQPEGIHAFDVLHHPGRTNGTSNLALSNSPWQIFWNS
jgi:hypothetical protein